MFTQLFAPSFTSKGSWVKLSDTIYTESKAHFPFFKWTTKLLNLLLLDIDSNRHLEMVQKKKSIKNNFTFKLIKDIEHKGRNVTSGIGMSSTTMWKSWQAILGSIILLTLKVMLFLSTYC